MTESPKHRFSQKTADFFRRFTPSPGNSSIWKAQETADFRRKPKIFAENRRKPQIGLRHLRCITFSSSLLGAIVLQTDSFCRTNYAVAVTDFSYSGVNSGVFRCRSCNSAWVFLRVRNIRKGLELVDTKYYLQRKFRKVWVSINSCPQNLVLPPPPPQTGPKMKKNCTNQYKILKIVTFCGGGEAILWTKRFYGHLGVSEKF